jgi:hydrogenase-1 operon protein HyaF
MTELNIYPEPRTDFRTGIPRFLLNEIAEHLERFVQTGETHTIDLKSLPMTEADLNDLNDMLGIGEVRADLAIVGKSEVWETAFNGVWRVRHLGTEDAVAADEIMITAIPDILVTHTEDARGAVKRLREAAHAFQSEPSREETANA